jgi:hypothetical protein
MADQLLLPTIQAALETLHPSTQLDLHFLGRSPLDRLYLHHIRQMFGPSLRDIPPVNPNLIPMACQNMVLVLKWGSGDTPTQGTPQHPPALGALSLRH